MKDYLPSKIKAPLWYYTPYFGCKGVYVSRATGVNHVFDKAYCLSYTDLVSSVQRFITTIALTTFYLLLVALPAYAIDICDYFPPCQDIKTPADLINKFLPLAMIFAGIAFFVLLILAGLQVIMHAGSGDAKEAGKWKSTLTAAAIGFILIVAAFWIMQFITTLTGVKIPGF